MRENWKKYGIQKLYWWQIKILQSWGVLIQKMGIELFGLIIVQLPEIATNHIILDITLAAQRLKFDPNIQLLKPMMNQPNLNLDDMLP